MLTEERYSKILAIVDNMGSVTVQQLMIALDASESTIRRDLTALDHEGKLKKVHGGALSKGENSSTRDDEVEKRQEKNKESKIQIARYAASLIVPGDFVYLDAGTTTQQMIPFLNPGAAIFVTNALTHAKQLAERGCSVYILGGEFKAITEAIVGEEAVETVSKYNFTKGFWGSNGVSVEKGFTTPELKEALVKRKSMENCASPFILADESKFGQISSIRFAEFDAATILTTNRTEECYRKMKNVHTIE